MLLKSLIMGLTIFFHSLLRAARTPFEVLEIIHCSLLFKIANYFFIIMEINLIWELESCFIMVPLLPRIFFKHHGSTHGLAIINFLEIVKSACHILLG